MYLYKSHLPDGRSYPIFYHKSITVDDTEKLCYPKGRTFIGGQSIPLTFSILKISKIDEFGVKKFQKITFGSNFTLKK